MLKLGKETQRRKCGLSHQVYLRATWVYVVTPVLVSACRIPQARRLVLGLKASKAWLSAQQRLTKWTWQSMSSGEGTGRCTVLRYCSGNGTGFAKLHPFASWNFLALHNLDSKGWLMGLFLQWKEKNVETVNYILEEGLTPSYNQLSSWTGAGSGVNRIQ